MTAEEFFYGLKNHYMDLGLDNLKNFMQKLDNPQNKTKVIHIAGTNGKGSVSGYITSILIEAGYKVGRYNSPVVFEKWENITINNQKLTNRRFSELVEKMKPAILQAEQNDRLPTVFELETALAYLYFAEEECDFAVIECGLGGLNDATNVTAATCLSVITSVSKDHIAYLGTTLTQIAIAKAGIIKEDRDIVMISQNPVVVEVIKKVAKQKHAPLTIVKKEEISIKEQSLERQKFSYPSQKTDVIYQISMSGSYQIENAVLAVEAVTRIKRNGYEITDIDIQNGLKKMIMPGRFEVLRKGSLKIILDGAHNADAALRLRETIQMFLKDENILFIMGVFADKDYKTIVANTCDLADNIYVVRADGPRALEESKLVQCIGELGKEAYSPANIKDALAIAMNNARGLTALNKKQSSVICFGSLSWLKHVKTALQEQRLENGRKNED